MRSFWGTFHFFWHHVMTLTSSNDILKVNFGKCFFAVSSHVSLVGWLVVFRTNVDLAIFQPYLDLEAGDNQSLKIQVARRGIEPRSSCSASQELNHSATTAPHMFHTSCTSIWHFLLIKQCYDLSNLNKFPIYFCYYAIYIKVKICCSTGDWKCLKIFVIGQHNKHYQYH